MSEEMTEQNIVSVSMAPGKLRAAGPLLLAGLLFTAGCVPDAESADPADVGESARIVTNGSLNGLTMNAPRLNGRAFPGLVISGTGTELNAVSLEGQALEGLHVVGSQLSAAVPGTTEVLTGAELVGALLDITFDESGTDVPYLLRIDAVELDAGAVTPDGYLHSISYRRQSDTVWRSICADAGGTPEPAIPIQGFRWDSLTGQSSADPYFMTLACESGAIRSCAGWGYRPWAPALVQHHQACIFMKRADYCGDGTAHTVDGTNIDIYDHLQPPIQTRATSWPLEAHWGLQGATCVSSRRHPEIPFSGQCLRDGAHVTLPACVETASSGDLLSNRAHSAQ